MTGRDYIIGEKTPIGLGIQSIRQLVVKSTEKRQPNDKTYNDKDFQIVVTNSDDVQNKITNYGKSELGTPVYSQVTFGLKTGSKGVQSFPVDGSGDKPITYSDITYTLTNSDVVYRLPVMTFQAILVSVSFPRNIVKTSIQGRDGTVKEYIGEGDAVISFRGVITGKNGHYPANEVNALKQLITAPISVPVTSDYLNNLGINNVVFDDRSFEQEEGGYSYQGFTINAISDNPIELHILK